MQLEQSFTLPFARAAAWPTFADLPMLVACMPGAALMGEPRPVGQGADLDLSFTVKLGPITGAFQGQGAVRRDDAAFSGIFSGTGADRKSGSRVKGEAKFSLVATAQTETRVDVSVDYSLTGALAQFSRGAIVKELAAALTRDFAANLREGIAKARPAGIAVAPAEISLAPAGMPVPKSPSAEQNGRAPAQSGTVVPQPAPALNAGNLVWRVLWARVLGWIGRSRH